MKSFPQRLLIKSELKELPMHNQGEHQFLGYNNVGGIVVSIAAFQAVDPSTISRKHRDLRYVYKISLSKLPQYIKYIF